MLSTEIQRVVLLIGLAVTGYLLILAWNAEYRQDDVPRDRVEEAAREEPRVVEPEEESVRDVPDPGMIGEPAPPVDPETDEPDREPADPVAPRAAETPEERLVRVRTDAHNVWIDRRGGDIVRLELPRYPVSLEREDIPSLLLDNAPERIYVAQSGLAGPDGIDGGPERPVFETNRGEYDFTTSGDGTVTLTTETGRARVRKVFTFRDDYLIDVAYEVENRGEEPLRAALFAQIKRGDHEAPSNGTPIGLQPYLGAALTTNEDRYVKLPFSDMEEGDFQEVVDGGWIAMLQHYFLSAWISREEERNRYYGRHRPDDTYVVGYTGPLQTIAPGSSSRFESRFYAGPKDQNRLAEIAPNLNLTVDYGFLWWLAMPLFQVLNFMHAIFNNWGVAIIMLTVVIKALLYPLSAASFRSMANMRRVAPQIKRLQERYGDDRQKLSQEMMALYKKEKANPLGGCLPMLLQMPVFISLYWVLFESVELRHAPFVLWINDLSAMDPFLVLPILMGASMLVQMQLNPPPPDPMQAKIMKFMPIAFTALFMFFPAGLVLYWLTNNVLSIAQQWYVIRQVEGAGSRRKRS